jgi:hypothetical protein
MPSALDNTDQQGSDPLSPAAVRGMTEGFEREAAPIRQQQERAAREPMPRQPRLERTEAPPSANVGNEAMLWLAAATALGGIAGAMTRHHTTNALAAFTGTLEGLKEGNQIKFDNNFKTWEAQARQVKQNNDAEIAEYKETIERRDLDERQRSIQFQIVAQKWRNQFMAGVAEHAVQTGDFSMVAASFDALTSQNDKGSGALEKIVQAREARAARMEQLAYQRDTTFGAAERRAQQGLESDDALMGRVEQKLAGNPTAAQGLRAGTPSEARFRELLAETMKERKISPEDLNKSAQRYGGQAAAERSLDTRTVALESVIRKTAATIPLALQASEQVPRAPILSLAQAQQLVETQVGDPKLKEFVGINLQLSELWARAQKGPTGVLDVGLQQQAFQFLATAQAKGSYRAAVGTIARGIQAEYDAQKQQGEGAPLPDLSKFGTQAAPPNAVNGGGGAAQGGNGAANPLLQQAKAFIQQARQSGKSDAEIKQYLLEKGKAAGYSEQQVEQFLNANPR